MKGTKKLSVMLGVCLILVACSSSDNDGSESNESENWLIPISDVKDGGPGKDGIPSIDEPAFVDNTTQEWQNFPARRLVVGVMDNGIPKAYSHSMLNWHEVVNDNSNGSYLTISYCPLTGSAVSWTNAMSLNVNRTFGVSGLLYNSNLILYDRGTDSNWSQMQLRAVSGSQSGTTLNESLIQTVETTWEQWQAWFPNTLLMSSESGFSRNYESYPYGDYLVSSRLLFEVDNMDDQRMHPKARALGVITSAETKVYKISDFLDDFEVINDVVGGEPVVIIGSRNQGFGIALNRGLEDGTVLEFTAHADGSSFRIEDQNGGVWTIMGKGESEGVAGQSLTMANHYTAFWFAWAAFFNQPTIHQF